MLERQLIVGKVYRFEFIPRFAIHGHSSDTSACIHKGRGVFRVDQIATFHDIVLSGVDLYKSFFEPCDVSKEEFNDYFAGKPNASYDKELTIVDVPVQVPQLADNGTTEYVTKNRAVYVPTGKEIVKQQHIDSISYGYYPIYKLVDVVNPNDIVYAPEKAILRFPTVDIKEYPSVTLAINVGPYKDPEVLTGLMEEVRNRMVGYGVQPLDVRLFSSDALWMTSEEYDKFKSNRVSADYVSITSENMHRYVGRIAIVGNFEKVICLPATGQTYDRDTFVDVHDFLPKDTVLDFSICTRDVAIPRSATLVKDGSNYKATFLPDLTKTYWRKKTVSGNNFYINEVYSSSPTVTLSKVTVPSGTSQIDANPTSRYYRISEGAYAVSEVFRAVAATADSSVYTSSGYTSLTDYYKAMVLTYLQTTGSEPIYVKEGSDYVLLTTDSYASKVVTGGSCAQIFNKADIIEVFPSVIKSSDVFYTTDELRETDLTSDAAIELIGKRFRFTNEYGTVSTVELNTANILGYALSEIPENGAGINPVATQEVYNRYRGRYFVYDHVSGNTVTQRYFKLDGNDLTSVRTMYSSITGSTNAKCRLCGTEGITFMNACVVSEDSSITRRKTHYEQLLESQDHVRELTAINLAYRNAIANAAAGS